MMSDETAASVASGHVEDTIPPVNRDDAAEGSENVQTGCSSGDGTSNLGDY